jgi:hypothetical protein
MAVKWIPKSSQIYINWCLTIKDSGWNNLNDWEQNFVSSLYERLFIHHNNLTQAQADKLETIYSEKTK